MSESILATEFKKRALAKTLWFKTSRGIWCIEDSTLRGNGLVEGDFVTTPFGRVSIREFKPYYINGELAGWKYHDAITFVGGLDLTIFND